MSVGGTATEQQEAFVCAVENRLRSEGLVPHTVGRNTFSADAPLKAVTELMARCAGTVVIALERSYFPSRAEKRGGPREATFSDVKLPTPWNHIEATMAYARGLPLLVIVESGLKCEGLLERGYDWYVQSVNPEAPSLNTNEFNGVLASWKRKMSETSIKAPMSRSPSDLTIGDLVLGLKPVQLWSVLGSVAAVIAGSFAVGAKLF